jgi:AhpD family alkylhydroperoxidase
MIKYIEPLPVSTSEGLLTEVYEQIRRDIGSVVEPYMMHSSSPLLLAGSWTILRETAQVGNVPRAVKEAVSAAVSKVNQCPYCVDAHTMMLMAAGNNEVARKISKDQTDSISDVKMNSIVKWSLATRSPGSYLLFNPPFTAQEAPEIIGTAVSFHYMNRMVSVLLSETPLPTASPLLKNILKRVGAKILFSASLKKHKTPGESLHFLPDAPLPDDLHWAKSHPFISRAFARFSAVTNTAGESILTEQSRSIVRHYIDDWDGKDPGISRHWIEQTVKTLTEPSKTAAKLALLTAIAPYQVDDEMIRDFRSIYKEDVQLLNVLAWSSFMAARKIGTWLAVRD